MTYQFPRVSLSLEINAEPRIHINESVMQSILFNILGNVEKHGSAQRGTIQASLTLGTGSLEIANLVPRSESPSITSNGFGLQINQKLCEAVGWGFTSRQQGGRFIVTIQFDPDSRSSVDVDTGSESIESSMQTST